MNPGKRNKIGRRSELGRNIRKQRSSGRVRTVSPPPSEPQEPSNGLGILLPPSRDDDLDQLRSEVRSLRRLQEAIHFLGSAPDLSSLRRDILDLAVSVAEMPRAMLALRVSSDDATPRYKVKEARGYDPSLRGAAEMRLLKGILNRSLTARETLLEGDILETGILGHAASPGRLELGAVVSLPLVHGGETLGALLLDDPSRRRPFDTGEQSLLRSFARHATLALARLADAQRQQRRAARLVRRADRLEGERERLSKTNEELRRVASESSQGSLSRFGPSYAEAKEAFTRAYLIEALRGSRGDLEGASRRAGLPLFRFLGLLTRLKIDPSRDLSSGWDRPLLHPRS